MPESNQDQQSFNEGDTVFKNSGEEGRFLGYIERDGRKYGNFQFGDINTQLPEELIFSRITQSRPQVDVPNRDTTAVRDRMLEALRDPHNYYLPEGLSMTEKQKEKFTEILEVAKQMGAVYRGDSRHPTEVNDNFPQLKPPFNDGFKVDFDTIGEGIYTTNDISTAFEYPEGSEEGYVYLIHNRSVLRTASDYETGTLYPGQMSQIRSGNIPASDIYAAFGHEGDTITDIYLNPSFIDSQPQ